MPSYVIAKEVGLTSLALAKITSTMFVFSQKDETRYNLGLCLKFESKGKKVLGYSKKGTKGWEFSSKARDLIKNYVWRFPEFFQNLNRNLKNDIYEVSDLFTLGDGHEQLEEMKKWLKEADVKSFEAVPLNSESLSKNVILNIESRINEMINNTVSDKKESSFVTVDKVPRQVIIKFIKN